MKEIMQIEEKQPCVYKTVVIGDGCVGKSAITMQFVSNVFLDFHDPTIEDAYQTQVVIDSEPAVIDILDTAAQDELQKNLKEQYMRQGECFVAVYAINDKNSFLSLRKHISMLKRLRDYENVPLVIVGNKLDLSHERQVSTTEGLALARECDCPFYEASAAFRLNIEDIFTGLIRQQRKKTDSDSDNELSKDKKPKLKRFRKYVQQKLHRKLSKSNST